MCEQSRISHIFLRQLLDFHFLSSSYRRRRRMEINVHLSNCKMINFLVSLKETLNEYFLRRPMSRVEIVKCRFMGE
jgi:hypothetical protein